MTDTTLSTKSLRKSLKLSEESLLPFAQHVFDQATQKQYLPPAVAAHLELVRKGALRLDPQLADAMAEGLRRWAVEKGAHYFTHWFQPLTHQSAEKHDSFLSRGEDGHFTSQLRGKELMFGEPDASSFPSGGARLTHEARGYTAWDPTAFPFLWESAEGMTLYIPALFYSWKGVSLDHRIPLLRSNQKIEAMGKRLLALCGFSAEHVFPTLGIEQEYFLLDEAKVRSRPDLLLTGRALFGAKSVKGQELEDHYCGVVKPHVLAFMRDFEEKALALGIPVKTRHNEVAPCQHEVAPIFEASTTACDHNLMLMEIMRQSALDHGLVCLFHEKPFAGLNGSGKHNNWSLATDTGINFLDPKENSLLFLATLAAVVSAVHEHAGLLRASIGSASNDFRLGGSEAPPSILSVFLGETLENLVHEIIQDKPMSVSMARTIDLGLSQMPSHVTDLTDRNRTSFFVFTGNKFEFRAVGASASCAFPMTILNAVVADRLQLILDEIEPSVKDNPKHALAAALPVLRKHFQSALPVLFNGNNYAAEWHVEAKARGLPNFTSSCHAFRLLQDKKSQRVLETILSEKELESRYEILVEQYAKTMQRDVALMLEMFFTQIMPAIQKDLTNRFKLFSLAATCGALPEAQMTMAREMSRMLDEAIQVANEMQQQVDQSKVFGWEAKANVCAELLLPNMQKLRKIVDQLELQTDDEYWPLCKIREILF